MSATPTLERLRIGCVSYLNAQPLVFAYSGTVMFAHPAELSQMLDAGTVDLALIPVFEVLRRPAYRIVDDVAIASRGAVHSVILAFRGEVKDIQTIALDPASQSSVHLLKVLLQECYGLNPKYVAGPVADAHLWIGSQAIYFRKEHADSFRYLDLGEEWMKCTGLPFVFAVWALRPAVPEAGADELRQLKQAGLAMRSEIAARTDDPEFALEYLTRCIHYDLRSEEKAGMEAYAGMLKKYGFLTAATMRFI